MNPQVTSLFHELSDMTASERRVYCQSHNVDPDLLREVESLLAFDHTSEPHLDNIVQEAASTSLDAESCDLDELCGPYRLIRIVGRGGMGAVYLADRSDGELCQQAAIKLLAFGMDTAGARQRFLRERQILANLSHSNIARLLDAGHRENGQPYLVMEYVDGKPLDEYCASVPLRRRVELFVEICEAVSYAHRMLVIHRDLKPGNILVGPDGTPKLLDFGIAKLMDATTDATATLERRLTPSYASPEQVRGRAVGTATDIYSLGAILYKLLTGRGPHQVREHMTPAELEAAICDTGVSRPSRLYSRIDKDLDAIVLKATRKEPEERYASVDKLGDDLRAWLDGKPVRARQGDWWYLTRRFVHRHWIATAALLVAISGLTAGLLVARHQRDVAERRFREVRQLAGQLFTIERDIQQVAGATKARERIVKTAVEYLERLSKEAGNDLDLKTEIASAYTKVANIEGGFRSTNLGRPADARVNLQKAETFFRDVLKAKPNDAAALHNLIEAVELRSRIEYGQLNGEGVEATLDELQKLAARYEPIAPANLDAWDFLGGIYQSMSNAMRRMGRTAQSLEFAKRSVDFQRKAAAVSDANYVQGNLAVALSAYSKALRAQGDVEGALAILQEDLQLNERLLRRDPTNNRGLINVAACYSEIASAYGEENGISLGRRAEAIQWYERGLEISRKVFRTDPQENQARYNTASMSVQLANVLRHEDPARALASYDEAIELFRGMPPKVGGRDVLLGIILAESTFPLRKLNRNAEALKRLTEAKKIAEETKDFAPDAPLKPIEAISRVEADMALSAGRPAEAAALHQAWLERMHFGKESIQRDLHGVMIFAHRYQLLSEAYRKAGQVELADQALAKRREILEFWRKKMPDNAFVASLLNGS